MTEMIRDLTEKSVLSVQAVSKEWHGLTLRKPYSQRGEHSNVVDSCKQLSLGKPPSHKDSKTQRKIRGFGPLRLCGLVQTCFDSTEFECSRVLSPHPDLLKRYYNKVV